MPELKLDAKPSVEAGRFSVRATNHATGEVWSIHDTKVVCQSELERKLDEWGKPGDDTVVTVEGPTKLET